MRHSGRQPEHRGERPAIGLERLRGLRLARPAQERDAEGATKQAAASAAASASKAPTAGTRNFNPHDGSCGLEQDRLEGQPLRDEAVERRQRRDRHAPTRNAKAVAGMRWMRPPSRSMSRSPVLVVTAPAPKNNRLLNTE